MQKVSLYYGGANLDAFRSLHTSVLTRVFEFYVEDSISDEQVTRILEPILKMIEEGAFDRPRNISGRGSSIWARPVELLFNKMKN